MSLDLDQMRKWLRKGAGNLTDDELPDEDADELLNMSLWELEDRFPFETKKSKYRFNMVVGQSTYSTAPLNTPNAIRSVAIIDSDTGARTKLDKMVRDWYDSNVVLSSNSQAKPTKYMREASCLYFDWDPDDTYLVEINFQEGVESLLEGTNESTGLPRNWDELVVQGAIWRAHFYTEDYQRARQAANFQIGGIRQAVPQIAKEDSDNRNARLDVRWE